MPANTFQNKHRVKFEKGQTGHPASESVSMDTGKPSDISKGGLLHSSLLITEAGGDSHRRAKLAAVGERGCLGSALVYVTCKLCDFSMLQVQSSIFSYVDCVG